MIVKKYTTIRTSEDMMVHPLSDVYTCLNELYYIQYLLRLYGKTDSETYDKTSEYIEYLQDTYIRPYFVDEMCMKYIRNGHEPPKELMDLTRMENMLCLK